MTKFTNPWVDPRVERVRPEQAERYLLGHGWTPRPVRGHFAPFAAPGADVSPVVRVPLLISGDDYVQRAIELVAGIARFEGRYAVHVLNEILGEATNGVPTNGATAAAGT